MLDRVGKSIMWVYEKIVSIEDMGVVTSFVNDSLIFNAILYI